MIILGHNSNQGSVTENHQSSYEFHWGLAKGHAETHECFEESDKPLSSQNLTGALTKMTYSANTGGTEKRSYEAEKTSDFKQTRAKKGGKRAHPGGV